MCRVEIEGPRCPFGNAAGECMCVPGGCGDKSVDKGSAGEAEKREKQPKPESAEPCGQ